MSDDEDVTDFRKRMDREDGRDDPQWDRYAIAWRRYRDAVKSFAEAHGMEYHQLYGTRLLPAHRPRWRTAAG